MAEVLLFHHAQGQTAGFEAFADELRRAGHTVHTPDLFDGRTFASIDEGVAYAEADRLPGELIERGERGADQLPARAGLRGLLARCAPGAEARADPRRRARGAAVLLVRPGVGVRAAGRRACRCRSTGWTPTRSSSARATSTPPASIVGVPEQAELFLYPGDQHYFADSSLPSYDARPRRCSPSGCSTSCEPGNRRLG